MHVAPATPAPGWIAAIPIPSRGPTDPTAQPRPSHEQEPEDRELARAIVVEKGEMPYVMDRGDDIEVGDTIFFQDGRYNQAPRIDGYVYLPAYVIVGWSKERL